MGQRLNIEIHENGELLANSYFHWSAYTSSAIELTKEALSVYDSIITNNPIQKAVRMLEETGAGIQEEELHDVVLKNDRLLNQLRFSRTSKDRNQGFIHVLEDDMYRTRDWDEGRVTIDIGDDTICFDVLYTDTVEDMLDAMEWTEEDLPPHINPDQYGCMIGEDWTFEGFSYFIDLYEQYPDGFQWTAPDGTDMVTYWVQ